MLELMSTRFTEHQRKARGFTIVELIIVIIVIAILASLTLVVYSGIQDRARSSVAQADLANAKKKLTIYHARNGSFPKTYQQLIDANMHFSKSIYEVNRPGKGNMYYCYNNATGTFAMGARTTNSAYGITITSTSDVKTVSGNTVTADYTCTLIGLSSSSDPNAITWQGLETGTANWRDWVQS
jgi:prepilin-type N-terminal cleavage/methylation domain-containing protein